MPLYKTHYINPQTTVKIWTITEPFNALMDSVVLTLNSRNRVLAMKSELHQRGFLSIRHLLLEFGYTDNDLYYNVEGKPHLRDGKHISITHSFTYAAVAISDTAVGVDIEKCRSKIRGIATKFIDYEHGYLLKESPNYIEELTIIWCIKESLYKLFSTAGLSFKQHTLVIPFNLEDETTTAWIDYNTKKHRFEAHFFTFDTFAFAITIPKP